MFDFNALLIDVASVSLILLPVDLIRMKKSGLLMDVIVLCCFFLSLLSKSS